MIVGYADPPRTTIPDYYGQVDDVLDQYNEHCAKRAARGDGPPRPEHVQAFWDAMLPPSPYWLE